MLLPHGDDTEYNEQDKWNDRKGCNKGQVLANRSCLQILVQPVILAGYKDPVFSFVSIADGVEDHEVLEALKDVPYRVHPGDLYQVIESVGLKGDEEVEGLLGPDEEADSDDYHEEDDAQGVGLGGEGGDAGARGIDR